KIEVQGAFTVRAMLPEAILVFIAPPSWEELERRLRSRPAENQDDVLRRLDIARRELDSAPDYDYLVVNDNIGPAAAALSANIIAKAAHGIADDLLSTALLATTAPIIVAPAMNTVMLEHPATEENFRILEERGVEFVNPATGILACRTEGPGKLAEVDAIV